MRLPLIASTTALLITGLLAAGAAHAGPQVQLQVTVETPVIRLGHLALPLPPIPVPRAVVVAPVYETRGYGEPRRWDADGDGIPNRHDPVYNPRWDRDGDGIPNRYDPRPNDPRNGRGWHGRDERRDDRRDWRAERDDRRDWRAERDEPRRDWRDEGHRR